MEAKAALKRIYLDNAATSWPKPDCVPASIARFYRESGAAAHRGNYGHAADVDRAINHCRTQLADLIKAERPDEIAFAFNGTDALNMAIHGMLRAGDHVVTSVVEHNSVLRPLNFLQQHLGIEVTVVGCDSLGRVDPEEVARSIGSETKLVCLAHASNVTGVVQPVNEVGRICREKEVLYLVDAAQSLGHWPIDVRQINCDMLAAPGHKGALGPLGTGIVYVASNLHAEILPLRQGGTGTDSDRDAQPDQFPQKMESGNLNVGGIVGLAGAIDFIKDKSVSAIGEHERELTAWLTAALNDNPCICVYCVESPSRCGTVSLNIKNQDPREIASILDTAFGIQVRAGLHCAPRMHGALGTTDTGGTVRISPGIFNSKQEIDHLIEALITVSEA